MKPAWLDITMASIGIALIAAGVGTWSIPAAMVTVGAITLGLVVLSRLVALR